VFSLLRRAPALWVAQQILKHGQRRWSRLPERDRRELRRLVAKSKGRLSNLTPRESADLKAIIRSFLRGS
jgi:regulator of sirC expression with transglutaminase-like and TPR domain